MIRINFAGRIHRVFIGDDGLVHWGAYAGGSGAILGFKGRLTDLGEVSETVAAILAAGGEVPSAVRGHLGAPGDALAVVGGLAVCPEVYLDGNRMSFEARWSDGKTWQRVMSADDFHLIQDWQVIDTEPAELITSGPPGPTGPLGPPVSDDEVAKVVKAVVKSAAAAL